MTKPSQRSASNDKKAKLKSKALSKLPIEVIDTTDPGDETQQRFRYQHAYGVILLTAALLKAKPYEAIWCEHHEDLLGQRNDGYYDAYQIKTQLPENGRWNLTKEPLKDSIKRFVTLDQKFPERFHDFYFISNVKHENPRTQNRAGRSPIKFLEAIQAIASHADLISPFDTTFETLRTHCECSPESLFLVLKKLKLANGPGLDSFEAEITQDHLHSLPLCRSWPATALALLRDDLIAQVYRASSLSVDGPSQHWHCLYGEDHHDPRLLAKRITVEDITRFIRRNRSHYIKAAQPVDDLPERLEETLSLYLKTSFNEDQFAKLDQAGETDQDSTPLRQVFVDLELKLRSNPHSLRYAQGPLPLFKIKEQNDELHKLLERVKQDKTLSAMSCLLQDFSRRMVLIGGPGQGKSTLGQYLAQVHRAVHLHCEEQLYHDISAKQMKQNKLKPRTLRIPFRIVLKYFAQWIADGPKIVSVEAYIAEQIGKVTSRPGDVSPSDVQEIIKHRPVLIIFDGLDEVTEPALRAHMLRCIEQFVERTEVFDANLQVLATSRPTGYSGQFNPQAYWHFELQPMSVNTVNTYATKWMETKVTLEEERRRVQDILQECLDEEHTRLLLTTPLQVTIVLLIIKDGGRPSAQREALFHQYWETILRREKAKFKEMIRTNDSTLFNLHAYLGYVLHRKAASENIRTLLSERDFSELVYHFLRKDDKYSPEESLRQQADQMVQEARDRLVLLVTPEPELFGFELRSLQEFFASAYLTQTARDTNQRFERFRAIARSQHWHNVALFFAGRIVRNYSGEAEKILIEGCQPIDREGLDCHLRRGAWLALDIAADGIFANNRNLQYSILEYGLTVLDRVITTDEHRNLVSTLRRLSLGDRRDMLGKILNQKLNLLPPSSQLELLEIYGEFYGAQSTFIQRLEAQLTSNQKESIQRALTLAFQNQVDPQWLARQLETHWDFWATDNRSPILEQLLVWWHKNNQYLQAVLSAILPSEEQVDLLLTTLLKRSRHIAWHGRGDFQLELLGNPQTPSDQIIIFLQCASALDYIDTAAEHIFSAKTIGLFRLPNIKKAYKPSDADFLTNLDCLLSRNDLALPLKIQLWMLYWLTHELDKNKVIAFLNEIKPWNEKGTLKFFLYTQLLYLHPLLTLALEYQINDNQNATTRLLPYLNESQEITISRQVRTAIKKFIHACSDEEQTHLLLDIYGDMANNIPELIPIVETLGIDTNELITTHVFPNFLRQDRSEYSSKSIQYAFSKILLNLNQPQKVQQMLEHLSHRVWTLDQETFDQGQQLLNVLIEISPKQLNMLSVAISLFLKLLIFDSAILSSASSLFPIIINGEEALKENPLVILPALEGMPLEHLIALANFIKHEDLHIQQGAFIFWEVMIKGIFIGLSLNIADTFQQDNTIRLDWQAVSKLLDESDTITRSRGIILLTLSNFPITEKRYQDRLLQILTKAQDSGEIAACIFFLQHTPMDSQNAAWQTILEQILDHPQFYTSNILMVAKRRYITLASKADTGAIDNEKVLGLSEPN